MQRVLFGLCWVEIMQVTKVQRVHTHTHTNTHTLTHTLTHTHAHTYTHALPLVLS